MAMNTKHFDASTQIISNQTCDEDHYKAYISHENLQGKIQDKIKKIDELMSNISIGPKKNALMLEKKSYDVSFSFKTLRLVKELISSIAIRFFPFTKLRDSRLKFSNGKQLNSFRFHIFFTSSTI
ncbi:unnamed protein product [Brachionus calyciflorus]|uniref:Uncharacterized protein n=1 Tax=Brachionus calyciflorus TaxID=104777 RepID=A0A813WU14_9BILA|nr:unnamed protein product [Brachionus calyciflorus]